MKMSKRQRAKENALFRKVALIGWVLPGAMILAVYVIARLGGASDNAVALCVVAISPICLIMAAVAGLMVPFHFLREFVHGFRGAIAKESKNNPQFARKVEKAKRKVALALVGEIKSKFEEARARN